MLQEEFPTFPKRLVTASIFIVDPFELYSLTDFALRLLPIICVECIESEAGRKVL